MLDDVAVDDVGVGCEDVCGGLIGRVDVDDVGIDVGIIVIGIGMRGALLVHCVGKKKLW